MQSVLFIQQREEQKNNKNNKQKKEKKNVVALSAHGHLFHILI